MKDIKESNGALKCKLIKFASIFLIPLVIGSGAGYYFGSKSQTGVEQHIAVGDLTVGDKLTMNEHLVDSDGIDNVTITDEELDKSNVFKEEDKIHFDKYTVNGIDKDGAKKIIDLEKNFKRVVYDYDHKFEDFVLDRSEFLGVLGADIELDEGSIFFDDSKIDDGEFYIYSVSKVDLGEEVSKEEAKTRLFNFLVIFFVFFYLGFALEKGR